MWYTCSGKRKDRKTSVDNSFGQKYQTHSREMTDRNRASYGVPPGRYRVRSCCVRRCFYSGVLTASTRALQNSVFTILPLLEWVISHARTTIAVGSKKGGETCSAAWLRILSECPPCANSRRIGLVVVAVDAVVRPSTIRAQREYYARYARIAARWAEDA